MNKTQEKIWSILVNMPAEEVAMAFANYHGLQILDEEFYKFLQAEMLGE